MPMNTKNTSSVKTSSKKVKDPFAVKIGARIKQARVMAGFNRIKDLNEILIKKYSWSSGRLGNYESGQSIPGPDDTLILANETDSSACWIFFGMGPIRSQSRDLQAIRYQNLVHAATEVRSNKKSYREFLEAAGSNHEAILKYLDNPFRKIGDRQARRFERALHKTKGWLDELIRVFHFKPKRLV